MKIEEEDSLLEYEDTSFDNVNTNKAHNFELRTESRGSLRVG
jgi:hypothetical protein